MPENPASIAAIVMGLQERERVVVAKEKELAIMKAQWESLKKKVSNQDKRLVETRQGLSQKEKYIKRVTANEKKQRDELATATQKLSVLQTTTELAANAAAALALEEQRSSGLAGETAKANGELAEEHRIQFEAARQTDALRAELEVMRAMQKELSSEAAQDRAVRERAVAELASALASAEAARDVLTAELARRAIDRFEQVRVHQERIHMLEQERNGVRSFLCPSAINYLWQSAFVSHLVVSPH